jgi:hypothetical protein
LASGRFRTFVETLDMPNEALAPLYEVAAIYADQKAEEALVAR